MNKLTIRAAAARQKMTDVRTKGLRRSLQEDGAIDLASIMVGVLVIGIVGGVIAATVFAVIPWSQDAAAEQALDSVATSQSVAYSFAAGEGDAKYASLAELEAGIGDDDALLQKTNGKIAIVLGVDADTYTAYSESATGKVLSITSANPADAVEVQGDVEAGVFTPAAAE